MLRNILESIVKELLLWFEKIGTISPFFVNGIPEKVKDISFEFIEDIGKTVFWASSDFSKSYATTKLDKSISSLGDNSIKCILFKSLVTLDPEKEVNGVLIVLLIWVRVILLTVVVLFKDPSGWNSVIVSQGFLDQVVPVQYKTISPVLYPSAFAEGDIDVVAFAVPASTVTKELFIYKLKVGTVIKVLVLITILFVIKFFS